MRTIVSMLFAALVITLFTSCHVDFSTLPPSVIGPAPLTPSQRFRGTRWANLDTTGESVEELVFNCNDTLWIVTTGQQDTVKATLVYDDVPPYDVHFYVWKEVDIMGHFSL